MGSDHANETILVWFGWKLDIDCAVLILGWVFWGYFCVGFVSWEAGNMFYV